MRSAIAKHTRRPAALHLLVVLTMTLVGSRAQAQEAKPASIQSPRHAAIVLAPGVLTTISPERLYGETVSTLDIAELRTADLQHTPNFTPESRTLYEMAAQVKFRRKIWALEFSFKPLRMIYVDVPQPTGRMQRKLIWYLVYNVRNLGEELAPNKKEDGSYEVVKSSEEIRFIPHLTLISHEFDKSYADRIIPAALEPIRRREAPHVRLLTSVEMAETPIPVSAGRDSQPVWGVAMWEDVDPQIDFFSVLVEGLTNALQIADDPKVDRQPGDLPGKGRSFRRKTLQLNFWRPGDTVDETEEEIRFGLPDNQAELYGVEPGVDYTWIYR